jgi:uncharacterized protein YndB with AHSA1/START domain
VGFCSSSVKIIDVNQFKQIGRVSSASVEKATGKSWDQWVALLDKVGARSWTHQEIVAFLKKKHKLGPWWQQGVTLGFEIATGRRLEGQDAKGEYMLTVTKSIHLEAKKVWKFVVSDEGQALWLKPLFSVAIKPGNAFETTDGFFGEIRTMQKERRIRMTWQDPNWSSRTTVEVIFVQRANGNSILCFNHTKLKDLRIQAKLRVRWKAVVEEIAEALKI